jgi:hypothetical protein
VKKDLIAPCGMNCGLCASYLAMTHDVRASGVRMTYCAGCRPRGKMCAFLKKRCELLELGRVEFCHECPDFPCRNLQALDDRYRARFRMSMVENLRVIRDKGIGRFLREQRTTWRCQECGGILSCHNGLCFRCDIEKLKSRKRKYQWESS